MVGGYKVTSGGVGNCYIVDDAEFRQMAPGARPARVIAAKENLGSVRLRQPLGPGTYHLVFAPVAGAPGATVAAEFYLESG